MKNTRRKKDELEKKRPTFLLIGLVLALGFTYSMLVLKTEQKPALPICKASAVSVGDETYVPRTWPQPEREDVQKEIEDQKKDLQETFIEVANDQKIKLIDEPVGKDVGPLEEIPIFKEEPIMEVDIYALEKMPVFPGCEDLINEEERYNCFVQQVSKHVVSNLKPCEGAFGVSKERLYIQFTIDEKGNVTAAKAIRGNDECNIDRALWVVNELPKMKPGEYRGKTVRTRFVLPINIK